MAEGAIRYNYNTEAWEFSNDRVKGGFNEFAVKAHTHASAEIEDASTNANPNAIVRRGPLGEAGFTRITVGSTSKMEGLYLRVGSPNNVQDPALSTVANITITGTSSNFKAVVQDGGGQYSLLWNATKANKGRYLISDEAPSRVSVNTNINGSSFEIYDASPGISNQDITWRQKFIVSAEGEMTLGVDTLKVTSDGNVYAQAFETQSARRLKHDIKPLTENALDILNAVVVHTFVYNKDTETQQQRVGIIADEVADTRMSGCDHDRFDIASTVGLLIKAVQELSQRVEDLEQGR